MYQQFGDIVIKNSPSVMHAVIEERWRQICQPLFASSHVSEVFPSVDWDIQPSPTANALSLNACASPPSVRQCYENTETKNTISRPL